MPVVTRRVDELPRALPPQRAWVFTIPRNLLLNAQRGALRRRALAVRLATEPAGHAAEHADDSG